MNYYFVAYSTKISEVGSVPQSSEIKLEYYNSAEMGREELLIGPPAFPKPILEKQAKATSILNIAAISHWYMVLSKELIENLENFNLPSYKIFDLELLKDGYINSDYSILYIEEPADELFINFGASRFLLGKIGDWKYKGKEIKVSDLKNYRATLEVLRNEGYKLQTDSLAFNSSSANLDMYRLSINQLIRGYIISEKFKKEFIKRGYTGATFKELSEISPLIKIQESL